VPVDAIAAVRKTLDPAGVVLYFRIRTDIPGGGLKTSYAETWSAQDPQRWRLKSWSTGGPKHHRVTQASYGRGASRWLYEKKLTVTTGYRDHTAGTRLPSMFGQSSSDPDADLRAQLASGKFKDEGEQQSGGRTVRRLSRDDGVRKLVVDVDPATFIPLGGTMSLRPPGKPLTEAMTMTFTVEAFERLPLTPETEKLLTFTVPRGTKVVTRTVEERRRQMAARRRDG
jgi:hypothetical protein